VDVRVHEARGDILAGRVNHFSGIANALSGIANKSNAALGYRDIYAFLDLAGAYVYQFRVFDDRIGLFNTHGNVCHFECHFIERLFTEFV
jgi:hypothetical protein